LNINLFTTAKINQHQYNQDLNHGKLWKYLIFDDISPSLNVSLIKYHLQRFFHTDHKFYRILNDQKLPFHLDIFVDKSDRLTKSYKLGPYVCSGHDCSSSCWLCMIFHNTNTCTVLMTFDCFDDIFCYVLTID
jgi:hypothetical protein